MRRYTPNSLRLILAVFAMIADLSVPRLMADAPVTIKTIAKLLMNVEFDRDQPESPRSRASYEKLQALDQSMVIGAVKSLYEHPEQSGIEEDNLAYSIVRALCLQMMQKLNLPSDEILAFTRKRFRQMTKEYLAEKHDGSLVVSPREAEATVSYLAYYGNSDDQAQIKLSAALIAHRGDEQGKHISESMENTLRITFKDKARDGIKGNAIKERRPNTVNQEIEPAHSTQLE